MQQQTLQKTIEGCAHLTGMPDANDDVEKKAVKKAYLRQWYLANKDACIARNKEWKKANPEKLKAARKRYRQKHKLGLQQKSKAWRLANAEAYKAIRDRYEYKRGYWRRYLLTAEKYAEMLAAQEGKCAICGTPNPGKGLAHFHVDHDHACCGGKRACGECTRALLCRECNLGIGHFRDSPDIAYAAALYLREHKRGCAKVL